MRISFWSWWSSDCLSTMFGCIHRGRVWRYEGGGRQKDMNNTISGVGILSQHKILFCYIESFLPCSTAFGSTHRGGCTTIYVPGVDKKDE